MHNYLERVLKTLKKQTVKQKIWKNTVRVIAWIVAFCTTYALILPAITLEMEMSCGLAEHTHTQDCYVQITESTVRKFICAPSHMHTEDCYDFGTGLICDYADFQVHTHNEFCYQDDTLLCAIPEIETHEHTENCYQITETRPVHVHDEGCYTYIRGELNCNLPESDGHMHSNGCYTFSDAPSCGMEEVVAHTHNEDCQQRVTVCESADADHVHVEECYQTEYICRMEETEGHSHGEGCFASVLNCGLEETEGHSHKDACFAQSRILSCDEEEGVEPVYELNCGKDAIVLHTHDSSCFDEDNKCICGRIEILEHIHDDKCICEVSVPLNTEDLICTIAEDEIHSHNFLCYGEWKLVCEIPEHTHNDQCYITENTIAPTDATEPQELPELEIVEESQDSALDLLAELTEEFVAGADVVGSNLTWTVTKNDANEYFLTFDGEGPMPDYTLYEKLPWMTPCSGKAIHLRFGPNVTRIGNWAFASMKFASFDWGGVEVIGSRAFQTASGISSVTINKNVKIIEEGAFWSYSYGIKELVLEEGLEVLYTNAFGGSNDNNPNGITIHIPASVIDIKGCPFSFANGYTVAEDNPYYTAVDGVLYTKDMTTLVDYPRCKSGEEFHIPDTVTTIKEAALSGRYLKRVYVPASVTTCTGWQAFGDSALQEIYFADNAKLKNLGTYAFMSSTQLRTIHFPENTDFRFNGNPFMNTTYPFLETINIPNGMTKVDRISHLGNSHFPALSNIFYDAKNAEITVSEHVFCDAKDYVLTIGPSVEKLPANFTAVAADAGEIVFTPGNSFELVSGGLKGSGAPLDNLSGTFHVDNQGLLYAYDATEKTAKLVYCPSNLVSITIPQTIQTENGDICTVNCVGKDALVKAFKLQSIQFEEPSVITKLESLAMANCLTLTSINGETTVSMAMALFTGVSTENLGANVFFATGLSGAPGSGNFSAEMDGKQQLSVTKPNATEMLIYVASSGSTLEWVPVKGDSTEGDSTEGDSTEGDSTEGDSSQEASVSGGYKLLTGDTLTINASVGNIEASTDNVYRIYFRVTGSDASISLSPGSDYVFDNIMASCRATSDPYTIYLEFTPPIGKTHSVYATCVYPQPNSSGGGLTVWGMVLSEEEATSNSGKILNPTDGDVLQAYWTTVPDEFQLTKSAVKPETKLGIISGDSHGAKPSENFSWKIVLSRATETTSAYGKDYVKSVDYIDSFQFPEGMTWHPDVVEAVKKGDVFYDGSAIYAGGRKVVQITCNNMTLRNTRLVWNEETDNVDICWSIYSSNVETEMNTNTLDLTIIREAVSINMTEFHMEGDFIRNNVTANVHHQYSEDEVRSSQAEKPIGGGAASIAIRKTSSVDSSKDPFFGEDVNYTIDLYNNGGLPYVRSDGYYTVRDTLPSSCYLKPENMQRMFIERPDLRIDISNATLGEWVPVKGAYNDQAWINTGNTQFGEGTVSLSVTYQPDNPKNEQFIVTVSNGTVVKAGSVATALQNAGYAVTYNAAYVCTWPQSTQEELGISVDPGEHQLFYVYATFKDTFRLLNTMDYPNEWPWDTRHFVVNRSRLYRDNTAVANHDVGNYVRREAVLSKYVFKDGIEMLNPSGHDGDVLDYQLHFSHMGTGVYDNLPLVDDIYGSQYLLAPVIEANNHLAGCEIYTDKDGSKYYILKLGNYTNVTVGVEDNGRSLIAASISVSNVKDETLPNLGGQERTYSGLMTRIKWYFAHLNGTQYRKIISYKTLIRTSSGEQTYSLGNVAWLNDDPGSRLYATLWGDGTILDFEKHIVVTKGEIPDDDVLADYSLVGAGESITYRIELRNTNDYSYYLYGDEIADALPNHHNNFTWNTANVKLSDIATSNSDIVHTGLNDWTIDDSYNGLMGEGQQYLRWPDTTQVLFKKAGSLYLYFTLTYPDESGENLWEQYSASVNGNTINNTFFLYTFTSTVEHNLRETGQVLLQKGVYGMYYHSTEWAWLYRPAGASRYYYNNKDSRNRSVAYYVTLYNGGGKRLYLNDLYDRLPDGFTYTYMLNDSNMSVSRHDGINQIVTKGGFEPFGDYPITQMLPAGVLYRSATVYADPSENGITFVFNAGQGEYAVSYDAERKQYFLNSGEAIVFAYTCDIGTSKETKDNATNVIAMPYTDYLDTGVVVLNSEQVSVTAAQSSFFYDYNDGSRYVLSNEQVSQAYGFEGEEENWLVSDVTVHRGGIVPGITKNTVSYTRLSTGETLPYKNGVSPGADYLVNWQILLHNSGTLSLTDYTVTDIMPSPYVFQGDVNLTIYDHWDTPMDSLNLFTISARNPVDTSILVTTSGGVQYSLKIGDPPTYMTSPGNYSYALSFYKDANGNEVMKMDCLSATMSIPEGGYVEIGLSSCNPTTTYENAVYTNRATLRPNVQDFDIVGQGSMIRDETGEIFGAENSSPVTVSYGYSTSSEKRVTEKLIPDNTAVSTDTDDRCITLKNADSVFTYTLTVGNDTDKPMTKLVLIDNLPEVEDHSPFKKDVARSSEFGVSLAGEPNFCVAVIPEDSSADPVVLNSDQYVLQFSKDTYFGEPQGPDWRGDLTGTTANWTADTTDARSIRLIIQDDSATVIPANSKIVMTFDAMVQTNADPGEIAWNSFGYHYALKDVSYELEAMPLTVGITIPSFPTLQKEIVGLDGRPTCVETDSEFNFLVYEGEPVTEEFDSLNSFLGYLDENQRAYREIMLTVRAGESESDPMVLDMENWKWTKDKKYTVVELPTSYQFEFLRFKGIGENQQTFTYDPGENYSFTCVNTMKEWTLALTKTDQNGNLLAGAEFALYSQYLEDQLQEIPEGFASAPLTIEQDRTTWYLMALGSTDDMGVLNFENLIREYYCIKEIKSPDGYWILEDTVKLCRINCKDGICNHSVINYTAYELPDTGGQGTGLYTVLGMLILAAGFMLCIIRKSTAKKRPSY